MLLLSSCKVDDNSTQVINSNQETTPKGKIITLKSGVRVKLVDGVYYLSDDIVLSNEQLISLEEEGHIYTGLTNTLVPETTLYPHTGMPLSFEQGIIRTKAVGQNPTPYNMWAMVRYVYGSSLSQTQREIMKAAIHHWENNSNVRFYNATGQPTIDPVLGFAYPYIEFIEWK